MSDARALPRNLAPGGPRVCRYCHEAFDPPRPDTTLCRGCYFAGEHHAERLAGFLRTVRKVAGDLPVDVEHTGGGCFWIACRIPIPGSADIRVVAFTVAYQGWPDQTWETDPTLPETSEGPWCAGHFTMLEDSTTEEPIAEDMPLTPAQCAAFLRDAIHSTPEAV